MKSKRVNIKYFISEGVKNIFLHGFMSIAAIGVIAACLLVTGSFTLIARNIDAVIESIEEQNEIMVYIDETLGEEEAQNVAVKITAIDNVKSVEFISKEKALKNFKDKLDEYSYILDGFENSDENPLRHGFRIRMKDIAMHAETVDALQKIPEIASTNSRQDISQKLIQVRRVVNAISMALLIMLGAVSVFIIANTVKLTTFTRREEIAIMKMVGATDGFITFPFVVEGLVLGEIGAVLAFFCQWGVYSYITKVLSDGIGMLDIIPFADFSWQLIGIFAIIGVIVGAGGSAVAIRKFLKV